MKRPWSKDDYQREFADEIIRQIERGGCALAEALEAGGAGVAPRTFTPGNLIPGGTTSTWPFAG